LKAFRRNFRYWLPVLLWLGVIAFESFRLSSDVTGSWLWRIIHLLHIRISASQFAELHHLLRKAGHLTGYGLLCLLLFRSWYHTLFDTGEEVIAGSASKRGRKSARHSPALRWRCVALALGLTLLTAMLDEWHQSFDVSRTGTPWDVVLDFVGALCFLAIALFGLGLWPTQPVEELEQVSV